MESPQQTLRRLRHSLEDEAEAAQAIRDLSGSDVEDADFHTALAEWAMEVDEPELALKQWNLASRDRPNDARILANLSEAYLDSGRLDKAVRQLRLLVELQPEDESTWSSLIEAERQLGKLEQAEEARLRALAHTGSFHFKTPVSLEVQEQLEPAQEEPFDEAFLTLFQERFQGREGVYARQWVDPNGQTGYSPVRDPVNSKVVKNHLLGNHTMGIYPLRLDNTVFFAAFDLDLAPTVLKHCAPGSAGWREATDGMARYADELEGRAAQMGLCLHRADSGFKGLHLWALFAEPIPAAQARQMCKAISSPLTLPPILRTEIFPKQNSLPQSGLGNLIKVPLGIHRKTGRRAYFSNPESDWGSQKEYLRTAELISREQLMQCQDRWSDEELSEVTLVAHPVAIDVAASAEPEYHRDTDDELQMLLARCVTLRALVSKVEQTGRLEHDEILVLTHTVGHLASGPSAVNSLLSQCLQTNSALYLKKPLRGNPMSCAGIRSRIPETTASLACDCRFANRSGLYPTPSLHLSCPASGPALELLQFQALLSDFLRAKREASRWQQLLQSYVAKIELWFEAAGVAELQTPYGLLRKKEAAESGDAGFELVV